MGVSGSQCRRRTDNDAGAMSRSRTFAGVDPDWARYPETILLFDSRPSLRIDLRSPLSPRERATLAQIVIAGEFAVITASDPQGKDLGSDENAGRTVARENRLRALGHSFIRVAAKSPDGSHREASMAIPTSKAQAIQLAREFGQVAIFWYDGDRFWIVGALADVEPIALPAD